MGRWWRRTMLSVHVAVSVGWFGAVAVSTVLAGAGLAGSDVDVVRGAWLMLRLVGWWALVPLSLLSLASGLAQSLGTHWGLVRHYWVLTKLVLNLVATGVLLLYVQTLDRVAAVAAQAGPDELAAGRLVDASPVVHSLAALVLLFVAIVLSVFKPVGSTRFGVRRARDRAEVRAT